MSKLKHKYITAVLAAMLSLFSLTSPKAKDWFMSLPVHYMVLIAGCSVSLLIAIAIRLFLF